MKFQPERAEGVNVISRHEPGGIWVGADGHRISVLVPWQGPVQAWGARDPQSLTAEHFRRILDLRPELVIFGSGLRLQFVKPALLRDLIDNRIGVETMDTAAACRTYNVLAAEGRCVVAALLLQS
jgi:uncharacterized protein